MLRSRAFLRYSIVFIALLFLLPAIADAEDTTRPPVDRIKILDGDNEVGVRGDIVTIRVEVLSPLRRGWLGGEGSRAPEGCPSSS